MKLLLVRGGSLVACLAVGAVLASLVASAQPAQQELRSVEVRDEPYEGHSAGHLVDEDSVVMDGGPAASSSRFRVPLTKRVMAVVAASVAALAALGYAGYSKYVGHVVKCDAAEVSANIFKCLKEGRKSFTVKTTAAEYTATPEYPAGFVEAVKNLSDGDVETAKTAIKASIEAVTLTTSATPITVNLRAAATQFALPLKGTKKEPVL